MISVCLSQGVSHSPSHVETLFPSGVLKSSPNINFTHQTKAVTPHLFSLTLISSVQQGFPSSVHTLIQSDFKSLSVDLSVCSPTSRDTISSLLRYLSFLFLPSLPIRKRNSHTYIQTISSFHLLMFILIRRHQFTTLV